MKVYPVPAGCNLDLQFDVLAPANARRRKKLQRLPHIFTKVLVLPFPWDADVSIVETSDFLRFSAVTEEVTHEVWVDAVEIYPGVTKVVIRGNGVVDSPATTDFNLDMWRFRLPVSMRAELASAAYYGGELVVTVPKGPEEAEQDGDGVVGGLVFV